MNPPTLIFAHGWGFMPSIWDTVLLSLREHVGTDVQCLCPALPGYALNEQDDIFDDSLIEKLPANMTVCGWSLGAWHAVRLTLRFPEKIRSLILVGASPHFLQTEDWPHAIPPSVLEQFRQGIETDTERSLQRFVALINQGDSRARHLLRIMQGQTAHHVPPSVLLQGLDELAHYDWRDTISHLKCPVTLIQGGRDSLMPQEAAHWVSRNALHSHLEVFEVAAHAPFLSDTERFCQIVKNHLDAVCHLPSAECP